ncbi:putative sulfate exporter family transporter [Dietzia cercidiphylli]|nr:putative sulfate exporter family transporter [Dietzia cercidiphylli]
MPVRYGRIPDCRLPDGPVRVHPGDVTTPLTARRREHGHAAVSRASDSATSGLTGVRVRARTLAPGTALTLAGTAAALGVGHLVPTLNPMLVAIVLGAALGNTVRLPARATAGLAFSSRTLLRVGIALLGLQLLLGDITALGWQVVALVVVIVVLGIAGTMALGGALGLGWTQRLLIACGFSICGAAAVAAVDSVSDTDEEEVLTAITLVVIFGTLMIVAVPVLSGALGLSDTAAGMWAGGSIHEVAQVIAAGGAIGGGALAVATVVKLARVLLLAPVVTVISLHRRRTTGTDARGTRPPLVPGFVVAFLALVLLRSSGLVPDPVVDAASLAQTVLLTCAMFALGIGVRVAAMRRVGARPVILAAASTVWVAGLALAGVLLIAPTLGG